MGQHQRLTWHDVCPTPHEVQVCVATSQNMPFFRAVIHNNPTSLASESAWKALVLSSWHLLGRPAVNTSESNCAHFLDARLELFWAEDWSALWAMVRAESDVAPAQNSTRRSDKQQIQSRVRMLLHRRETRSRLFKRSRVYTRLTQNPQLLCTLAENNDLCVHVIAHTATTAVHNSVLQYLQAGQITPFAKPTEGHKLFMMSFLHELALKSVMAAEKESVAKCVGPL